MSRKRGGSGPSGATLPTIRRGLETGPRRRWLAPGTYATATSRQETLRRAGTERAFAPRSRPLGRGPRGPGRVRAWAPTLPVSVWSVRRETTRCGPAPRTGSAPPGAAHATEGRRPQESRQRPRQGPPTRSARPPAGSCPGAVRASRAERPARSGGRRGRSGPDRLPRRRAPSPPARPARTAHRGAARRRPLRRRAAGSRRCR